MTAKERHYACFAGGHEKLAGRIDVRLLKNTGGLFQ